MAKFYMATAPYYNGGAQIALNLDNITVVIDEDDGCTVRMVDGRSVFISEKYESFMKNVTPFVPFGEMNTDNRHSEWLRNYIERLSKGDTSC